MILNLLRGLYLQWLKFYFFFHGPRWVKNSQPIVSYGSCVADVKTVSHGGGVKLTLLNKVYPDSPRCNLVYLVSSALNIYSQVWAEKAVRRNIKLVWNQNGVAYSAWAPAHHGRLNRRMALMLHQASYVVYQSRFCQATSDRFLGEFKGPRAIVYNAVDTKFFSPDHQPQRAKSTTRLLVMGSHEHPGRVMISLKVVEALKQEGFDVRLTIAGRLIWPNALAQVQEAIREYGLDRFVEVQGPYSQRQAPGIYRQSDILFHLKHADPCPTVVIEALACGLPVIGCNSGGMPELVDQRCGVLVPVPQDLEQIYTPSVDDVVMAVKTIRHDYQAYAHAARQRAETTFDQSVWLAQHKLIFEKVLA